MNKAVKGLMKANPTSECDVAVGLEPGAMKIKVSRDTFRVSKSKLEVAQWFCSRKDVEQDHVHGKDSACFIVRFDKQDGSPFESIEFKSDQNGYACSGKVRGDVEPDESKFYNYRVIMNGKNDLDPKGVIKP